MLDDLGEHTRWKLARNAQRFTVWASPTGLIYIRLYVPQTCYIIYRYAGVHAVGINTSLCGFSPELVNNITVAIVMVMNC